MIFLNKIEEYFNSICEVGEITKRVFYLTEEGEISEYVNDISTEDMPFLMVIIPQYISKKGSNADNYQEVAKFLCYVLSKEDNFNFTTFEIQKELQKNINLLKEHIIKTSQSCHWLNGLEVDSFEIQPENKLFSQLTGWSISFDVNG